MTGRALPDLAKTAVVCASATFLLAACGATSQVPYGQPQSAVRSLASINLIDQELKASGGFEFNFKRVDVDRLGPPRSTAVERYLRAHSHLLPPQCVNGPRYVRGGHTEGGWGWAIFLCRS